MVEVAVHTARGTTFFTRDDDAWKSARMPAGGLWPVARPGSDEWTTSVVAETTRLSHLGRSGHWLDVPGSVTDPAMMLGPRLAHYALWAPDGRAICYVVPDGRALSLKTWRPGDAGVKTYLSASPVFPVWLPASDWMVVHHGATLAAFETASGEQRILSTSASGFRTPAVSAGGLIAWAEVADGAVRVMCSDGFESPRLAGSFSGGVALSFRPNTGELVAAVASAPESGVFSELVHIRDGDAQRILSGPLVAYWWAPNGDSVLTLHPTYSGDGRFQPRLYDAEGRFLGAIEPLIPASDTATVVGFFDQYATSHPFWSADSRWFGLCGRFLTEGPHPSFSGGGEECAWVWDTGARASPERLGPGSMLAFSRG